MYIVCMFKAPVIIRCSPTINTNISAIVTPLCRQLTELEKSLFLSSSFMIPAHSSVAVYNPFHLKQSGRNICCKSKSKSTLRDNTVIVYTDGKGQMSYGHLLDIIVFQQSDCGGCITVSALRRSGDIVCRDSITKASVDDHLVSLLSLK